MGCSIDGWAQSDHFIYLQSDTKQPFYVKLGATASPLTSSSSGYLILPRVSQGPFAFLVGFPDNSAPEQHFSVTINADKGFLLKHFPDKGWALYDLQELTIIYASRPDSVPPVPDTTGKGHAPDSAGQAVAQPVAPAPAQTVAPAPTPVQATQTTAVQTTDTAKTQATTPDTVPPIAPPKADAFGDALVAVTRDSTLRNVKVIKRTPQVVPPVTTPPPAGGAAAIVLVSRQVADDGVHLVYTDRLASGGVDTVQVLMPKGTGVAGSIGATTAGTIPGADAQTAAPTNTAISPVQDSAQPPVTTPVTTTSPTGGAGMPTVGGTGMTAATDSAKVKAGTGAQTADTNTTIPAVNQSVTPADTTHAFNPAAVAGSGKTKDTSNYVVPVFKQEGGAATNTSSSQSLAAGFGVQPTTPAATTGMASTGAATTGAASTGAAKGLQLSNSNCNRVASDEEYQKLRKRMASESDVDRMIELARKAFKKSCFTTEQIRSLTFLFNLEDGRYKFVEEAYPFVSDSYNFKSLQALFSSVYFVNRFKALVER